MKLSRRSFLASLPFIPLAAKAVLSGSDVSKSENISAPRVQIGTDSDWAEVECSGMAIKSDGTLWHWNPGEYVGEVKWINTPDNRG